MMRYASIEDLIAGECHGFNLECGPTTTDEVARALAAHYADRRCAFLRTDDRGCERDTVRAHLALFARLAGSAAVAHEVDAALARFVLHSLEKTRLARLDDEQRTLVGCARVSLSGAAVCFLERPLSQLSGDFRRLVISWIAQAHEQGTIIATAGQSLREALLLPNPSFFEDEDGFAAAPLEDDEAPYEGDEVRILKIPAKTEAGTLLFDPREIDFAESANKATYVSVHGVLYQTPRTMDELEEELSQAGFFRCHRSYLVNVQKVAKVERYTRNSFNLTLSDANASSIPLAKGRAEEMRERYGWGRR